MPYTIRRSARAPTRATARVAGRRWQRRMLSGCTPEAGGVAEWSKAPVLKTGSPQGLGGSNPSPSVVSFSDLLGGAGQIVEICRELLGLDDAQIAELVAAGALDPVEPPSA